MIFVAHPVISCFESAISMHLLGVWQIQPLGLTGSGGGGGRKHWFLNIIPTGINPTRVGLASKRRLLSKGRASQIR